MSSLVKIAAETYSASPIAQAIASFIPGWAFVTPLLANLATEAQKERAEEFCRILATSNPIIPEHLLNDKDFVHSLQITGFSVTKTQQREKIRLLAKLLAAGMSTPPKISFRSEYEEMLSTLDELSFREIRILTILQKFESLHTCLDGKELARALEFKDEFPIAVSRELSIELDEIPGIMTRLNRTGLYETFIGSYAGYKGGLGKLTRNFYRLADVLQLETESMVGLTIASLRFELN